MDIQAGYRGSPQRIAAVGSHRFEPKGAAFVNGNPSNVRGQVVQTLRSAILSGVLQPGEKLSDGKLCNDLGVSRTSVREALRYLESEKLITVRNGRMKVSRMSASEVMTVYQFLGLLLGGAAAQIAEQLPISYARLLRTMHVEISLQIENDSSSDAGFLAARFYALVLDAQDNSVIGDMVRMLLARSGFLRGRSLAETKRAGLSLRELAAISTAILARVPVAARRAAMVHFDEEGKAALRLIDSAGGILKAA